MVEKNNEKQMLIINMFTGKYLQENIGHEIINIFKADNNKNYIFVPPFGSVSQDRENKVDKVLLTRYVGNNIVEVLGLASDLKEVYFDCKKGNKRQSDYLRENKVKYGGYYIDEIMNNNQFYGKATVKINVGNEIIDDIIYITYEAKKLIIPNKPLVIKLKSSGTKETDNLIEVGIKASKLANNHSMKRYLGESSKLYQELAAKVLKEEYWNKSHKLKSVNVDKNPHLNKFNFLTLIGKEYDELSFSNMISYFLSNDYKLFNAFLKDLGIIETCHKNDYYITREENNIDLLIRTPKHLIVIENKIKSHLNGLKVDENNQVVANQLDKYYKYAKTKVSDKLDEDYKKMIKCYLFEPNYNDIELKRDIEKKYTKIKYEKLYNFFSKHEYKGINKLYYEDFINALKIHTKKSAFNLYEEMQNKFCYTINKLKDN